MGLSNDSSHGEAIGFAQSESINFQGNTRWFLDFLGLGGQKKAFDATLSTLNYRDMGYGMGQRMGLSELIAKLPPNSIIKYLLTAIINTQ